MEQFLNQLLFENPIKYYLWALGAIFLVLLLNRYVARFIVSIMFRIFRLWLPDAKAGEFSRLLLLPIRWLFVLLAGLFILQILKFPNAWEMEIMDIPLRRWRRGIIELIFIIVATWIIVRVIDAISIVIFGRTKDGEERNPADRQILLFVKDLIKITILISCILFILRNVFKLDVTALLTTAGIAGIALALAAKETLQNLIASFTIFLEQPFVVGDYVQLDSTSGIVEKVGFRSTRLRTTEKTFVTIPNSKMIEGALDNMSKRTFRRVQFTVALSYKTKREQIRAILEELKEYISSYAYSETDITVVFDSFGENSLNIFVQYYLNEESWPLFMQHKEEINFKIIEVVRKHKAYFGVPERIVYIDKLEQ